jgi:hypothetical protein
VKTAASLIVSLCLLAGILGADNGQMSPEEKRVLEITPGVVLVVVTYKAQLAIPRQNADPLVTEYSLSLMGSGFLYRPDGCRPTEWRSCFRRQKRRRGTDLFPLEEARRS